MNVCVLPPPHFYVDVLTCNVIVLGDGALGKSLGLDEVLRMEPHDEISACIRRKRATRVSFLCYVRI